MRVTSSEQHSAHTPYLGMFDSRLDQELAETAPAIPAIDKDV